MKGWLVPGAGLLRPRSIPPVGVNAECLSTSPTLISFPVALWSPQLWSDEVEKVSTQLKWCSNLFGRAGGVQCGCCRFLPICCAYGKISARAASPDAVLLSAVLTVAYEEAAPEPAGCA